jgi:hypothetical protein
MANYYGTARSNYFRVKDEAEFIKWAEGLGLEIIRDEAGRFGLLPGDMSEGTFPSYSEEVEAKDPESMGEIDVLDEISKHLAPGSVAIIMEAGAEKMRYIQGIATAINDKGETEQVDIAEIYDRAKKLGKEITECQY